MWRAPAVHRVKVRADEVGEGQLLEIHILIGQADAAVSAHLRQRRRRLVEVGRKELGERIDVLAFTERRGAGLALCK
jgi:hypothetical protein